MFLRLSPSKLQRVYAQSLVARELFILLRFSLKHPTSKQLHARTQAIVSAYSHLFDPPDLSNPPPPLSFCPFCQASWNSSTEIHDILCPLIAPFVIRDS